MIRLAANNLYNELYAAGFTQSELSIVHLDGQRYVVMISPRGAKYHVEAIEEFPGSIGLRFFTTLDDWNRKQDPARKTFVVDAAEVARLVYG